MHSVVTRKQPKRNVLALSRSFTVQIAVVLEALKSHRTSKDLDQNRKLLDSFKKLQEEMNVMIEGVKDTSLSTSKFHGNEASIYAY